VADRLGAPATLDGLFRSGLATDPRRRPPSAALLADAFDQVARQLERPLAAGPATYRPDPGDPSPQQQFPPPSGPPLEVHLPSGLPVRPVAPAPPMTSPASPVRAGAARVGRSSVFYVGMTVLAIVAFAAFLGIVIALSL
jgi:hypothetical protein